MTTIPIIAVALQASEIKELPRLKRLQLHQNF